MLTPFGRYFMDRAHIHSECDLMLLTQGDYDKLLAACQGIPFNEIVIRATPLKQDDTFDGDTQDAIVLDLLCPLNFSSGICLASDGSDDEQVDSAFAASPSQPFDVFQNAAYAADSNDQPDLLGDEPDQEPDLALFDILAQTRDDGGSYA